MEAMGYAKASPIRIDSTLAKLIADSSFKKSAKKHDSCFYDQSNFCVVFSGKIYI